MDRQLIESLKREREAIGTWVSEHYDMPHYIYRICKEKMDELDYSIRHHTGTLRILEKTAGGLGDF
ncbi:hypothetical protein [Alicyclobacillus sp. SP_1]|uniref:hypothetical protein n=1 Tax=Alicyclobacillus sp. SP_1 TaxID=2942475 RepID=UPI0021577FA1|nr:hypothetical protein [Alicyclobacillus sp. SP_1]